MEVEGEGRWYPAEKMTPNTYRERWLEELALGHEARVARSGPNAATDDQLRLYIAEEPEFTVGYDDLFYTGRNYALFWKLSGVRGPIEDIEPMTGLAAYETNGFPDDLSPEVAEALPLDNMDLHSFTHYTLTELLEVDWQEFDREWGPGFYNTVLQMQVVAIEKCGGNTDRVRAVFAYDN